MEADYLMLADSAQVVGEKLYLLGGGWTMLNAPQLPFSVPIGIAVGINVDWLETNRRHSFKLELLHEDDGGRVLVSVEGEFEAGRPPGIPAGMVQKVQMAFNVTPKFERAGPYVARLMLDNQTAKRQTFNVAGASEPPSATEH
jgi:hypothetical protein